MEAMRAASPWRMTSARIARLAGGLYFFTLLSSALLEWLLPGKMDLTAGLIEIAGMSAVTIAIYFLFKAVKMSLSMLAAACNFAGIALEAAKLQSHGTDIAMIFHGAFCILIAWLIFRSAFLPLFLSRLIGVAGLAWLTYGFPPLAVALAPWNLIVGLAGEASVFLWLLAMGVNERPGNERGRKVGLFGGREHRPADGAASAPAE